MNTILHRLAGMVPTLFLVVGLVFMLIHLVPGDPVVALLGDRASPADYMALREALGLNQPLWWQFVSFVGGVFKGDWGVSLISQKPVLGMIWERLPATGVLAAGAMGFALVVGGIAGCAMAFGRKTVRTSVDYISLAAMASPSFVVGPLLIVGVAVGLGILPVSGMQGAASMVLPSVTLGLGLSAVVARMLAESLLEERHKDYVRTVVAKGGEMRRVRWHVVRNALLPTVQIVFLQLGMVLTGAVLTEAVFGWPGLGNLLVEALHQRDYPVIQGCLLLISLVYMLCVLLADVVSALLDPRVR
ncbi:MAG: ABC transporter permease [Blastochloris viridis]|uniref:ABC transporter permease n=1 Tax=Blastochloris viridis TaxID=1079 RepID=A0A6N4RE27_BLAVI|nr:MAG: ABC transporter permease [Blastochloris viridis]